MAKKPKADQAKKLQSVRRNSVARKPEADRAEKRHVKPEEWLVLVCVMGASVIHAFHFNHLCDDAYISFRYVRNLVEGHGLVFNPGETVLGSSNLLWMLLLAPFEALGLGAPLGAQILGIGFGLATQLSLFLYFKKCLYPIWIRLGAISLLAANGTFALWCLGGLEGPLLTFLIAQGCISAMQLGRIESLRRHASAGLWFGLAAITRPEAIGYGLAVALTLWIRGAGPKRLFGAILFALVPMGFFLCVILWTWITYGEPLPNTYYAKAHPVSWALLVRGLGFVRSFVTDYNGIPLLIVGLWVYAVRFERKARGWVPLGVLGAFILFFLSVGGDALVYHRMWMWTLPLFSLLAASALHRMALKTHRHRGLVILVGCMVILNIPVSLVGVKIEYQHHDDAFVKDLIIIGQALTHLPPTTTVALNNVGAIGYTSGLFIIDMLGLTDSHIAKAPNKTLGIPGHESHDGSYVLERQPDVIFLLMPKAYPRPMTELPPQNSGYPSDRDLLADPRLLFQYQIDNFRLPDGRYVPHLRRRYPTKG